MLRIAWLCTLPRRQVIHFSHTPLATLLYLQLHDTVLEISSYNPIDIVSSLPQMWEGKPSIILSLNFLHSMHIKQLFN